MTRSPVSSGSSSIRLRGSRNKYKFDEELGVFKLSRILPVGGCLFRSTSDLFPGTRAEDGDALDVSGSQVRRRAGRRTSWFTSDSSA